MIPNAFSSSLLTGVWYRAELERNAATLTATITNLDGSVVYGQVSFDDDGSYGTPRQGGYPMVCSGFYGNGKRSPYFDNFEYELGWPAGSGPQNCGQEGTTYLNADILQDCRVNLQDLNLLASQWLECTHPGDNNCMLP